MDLDALDAMLATIASEQLTGDPLWLQEQVPGVM